MPEFIGWVIERRDNPGFIAGFRSGMAELELDPVRVRPLVSPEPDLPGNRLNDAKADGRGRIRAETMPQSEDHPGGRLYRLDPDRRMTRMNDGHVVCNGPALSPDEHILYHTDSIVRRIYRFALNADGMLTDKRVFIAFEEEWGYPDDMTCDADGHLSVGHFGGGRISRFSQDRKLERSIALPCSQITNVCFAGPKLDRMFVTSAARSKPDEKLAGNLFGILGHGATGLPPGQYGG